LETNVINQIFGGYLKSEIKTESGYKSMIYEAFITLSLQCTSSIEKSLKQFTSYDKLEGNNQYFCPTTKKLENATKQFTIYKPPLVLIIHMKRFSPSGKKITNFIEFQDQMDIREYTSFPGENCGYQLHGIVVHQGQNRSSGHYYALIKGANNVWYEIDDDSIKQVGIKTVLKENIYMLFYSRVFEKNEFHEKKYMNQNENEIKIERNGVKIERINNDQIKSKNESKKVIISNNDKIKNDTEDNNDIKNQNDSDVDDDNDIKNESDDDNNKNNDKINDEKMKENKSKINIKNEIKKNLKPLLINNEKEEEEEEEIKQSILTPEKLKNIKELLSPKVSSPFGKKFISPFKISSPFKYSSPILKSPRSPFQMISNQTYNLRRRDKKIKFKKLNLTNDDEKIKLNKNDENDKLKNESDEEKNNEKNKIKKNKKTNDEKNKLNESDEEKNKKEKKKKTTKKILDDEEILKDIKIDEKVNDEKVNDENLDIENKLNEIYKNNVSKWNNDENENLEPENKKRKLNDSIDFEELWDKHLSQGKQKKKKLKLSLDEWKVGSQEFQKTNNSKYSKPNKY
jgi:hypothetical protein